VGLAGELRAVTGLTRRVREAQRLGATRAVVPRDGDIEFVTGVEVIRCRTLAEAIQTANQSRFDQSLVE